MIDLAVITSAPHLAGLASGGSIDMALTHLVLDHPAHTAYFAGRSAAGGRVILDNSAYELRHATGRGMDPGTVFEAARRIHPTIIICQDVLYDGPATVETTRAFLHRAAAEAEPGQYQYMAVPQGRTRTEWLRCYRELRELPGIAMVGLSKLSVPRSFAAPVAEARLACVQTLLAEEPPGLPLHLLGGDRSLIWELREHRRRSHDTWIASNDSSFAYWYAAHDLPADPGTGRATHTLRDAPDLGDHTLTDAQQRIARQHIDQLRDAAGLTALTPSTPALEEPPCP